MILVHSAFRLISDEVTMQTNQQQNAEGNRYFLRYAGYQTACLKYRAELEAIQKFFPGWLPNPPSAR